jgi:hypothetical protein
LQGCREIEGERKKAAGAEGREGGRYGSRVAKTANQCDTSIGFPQQHQQKKTFFTASQKETRSQINNIVRLRYGVSSSLVAGNKSRRSKQ